MAFQEMTREQFIQMLIDRGWNKQQAVEEWEHLQNEEDESGYDGP